MVQKSCQPVDHMVNYIPLFTMGFHVSQVVRWLALLSRWFSIFRTSSGRIWTRSLEGQTTAVCLVSPKTSSSALRSINLAPVELLPPSKASSRYDCVIIILLMAQIPSYWFPLIDKYINPFLQIASCYIGCSSCLKEDLPGHYLIVHNSAAIREGLPGATDFFQTANCLACISTICGFK